MPPSDENTTVASEELTEKFKQIMRKNGITDDVQEVLITEPPELQGEHMATSTVYVTISFKDAKLKPKNLFVKKFSSNEMHTQMVKKMRIMEKESSFFNDFLPTANKFCKDRIGVENMIDFFPKCLHGDDELIVQENLVLDGKYTMHSKEDRQDECTARVVIGHLAKFHAVSYAMIQEDGIDEFKKKWALNIIESFDNENNPVMDAMFDNGLNTCMNIVKLQGNEFPDADDTVKALTSYVGKVGSGIKKCYTRDENSKLVVLNHGDCWNNNMMFKRDPETGKVTNHIFVDLQITRLGSPCLDLGNFLFTSVKNDVRRNKVKDLLKFYYDEFNKTAELFSCSFPVTFEEFLIDFKNNCIPGYYITLTLLSAIGAMKEVSIDDDFGSDMDKAMEKFNRIISAWIDRNPDVAKAIASGIVETVKEYESMQANW